MTAVLNKLSNLQQRVITGIIGGVLIITAIYLSDWSYFAIFFIICTLSQFEFYKLIGIDGWTPLKFFGTLIGLFIFSLTFLVEKSLLPPTIYYLIFPVFSSIFFVVLYKKDQKKPFTNIAFTILGVMYIAIPFALLNLSVFKNHLYSYQTILGILLLLWSSDSGAYFAGRKFGKTKLFERVSPKKTWEGSLGGAAAAILMALFLGNYFKDLTELQWFGITVIIVIAGTYGDLVESLLKRSISIKDSGTFIPGHGGFLDRFDGLLLAAPFIVAFLRLFS